MRPVPAADHVPARKLRTGRSPGVIAAAFLALVTACSTVTVGVAIPDVGAGATSSPATTAPRSTTATTGTAKTPPTTAPTIATTSAPVPTTALTTGSEPTAPTTTAPTAPPRYPDPAGTPRIPAPPKRLPDPYNTANTVSTADAAPLLNQLTDAMGSGDRTAFLGHFRGEALRRASFWWDNLAAIGMDGGAVSTYADNWNLVNLNRANRGWLFNVQAGAHYPGDDVDAQGRQVIPTSSYYWKVQLTGTELAVVEWISLDQVPWDCLCRLHVATTDQDVVVSYPDEAAVADGLVDTLTTATAWNRHFFATAAPQLAPLGGVVAFATNEDDRLLTWFQSIVFTDPNFPGGVPAAAVHTLRGYTGPSPDLVSGKDFQGARIVIGAGSAGWVTPVLVHELVHYLFARYDDAPYWLAENTYVIEGLAEMVQQIHEGTPAEDAGKGIWTVGTRDQAWNIYPDLVDAQFKGKPPSVEQLRLKDLNLTNFWYDVAASTYSYIAVKYGTSAAVEAGICAYGGHPLFACVADPDSRHPGTGTPGDHSYVNSAALQKSWARWFRKTYG
ncbi:hypothetical protein D1871_13575 [Nakamurella silvestris]|nr:hypothetical protein D1871_13575 [Nakamurella silvestris]